MIIRDMAQLMGMLEDGQLAQDMMTDINAALQATRDAAGPKGKAKATLTLKIDIVTQGVTTDLECDFTVKKPKVKRGVSTFFATDAGLSDQHPKQMAMPFRDVKMNAAGDN